jgi:hypothetical protein
MVRHTAFRWQKIFIGHYVYNGANIAPILWFSKRWLKNF